MGRDSDRERVTLRDLLTRYPSAGSVVWIGVRPGHGAPMRELDEAELVAAKGLRDDVTSQGRGGGTRQVTLIQEEHLAVIARLVSRDSVPPALLRRNLVVRGINLHALRRQRFCVGDAVLEGTGSCEPCSQMERVLGFGGYNAVRGHGGITARVLSGGAARIGDAVRWHG